MADEETIRNYITALDHMRYFFQELLEEDDKLSKKPSNRGEYLKEFTELKDMIASGAWPLAVPENSIINTEQDKIDRAKSILNEYIPEDIKEKRFLEYGCEEGHIVDLAHKQGASIAVGWNSKENNWEDKNGILTTNEKTIQTLAPYDIALLYDSLDHCKDPLETLTNIKKSLGDNSVVYVRCHPWTSRNATHIYRQKNLAYIHLICTEEELIKLGLKSKPTVKTIDPESTYLHWFKETGFDVINSEKINTPVEIFFTNKQLLKSRIQNNYPNISKKSMKLQFIDYILCTK